MVSLDERAVPTICGFCHTNCGITAYVSDGVLRRIKADPDHPASRGDMCPKAVAAPKVVYSPDRLEYPLRRTSKGFQKISWDEALDIIASRLLEIKEKYGAESLVLCLGAPVTQSARDGFIQLLAAYGSMNITGPGHLCHVPREIAFRSVYGGMTEPDFKNSRCIVIWGSNPEDSRRFGEAAHGRYSRLIPDARSQGAKIIVIDPRRIGLVGLADKWLQIAPGRDDALALAMLNVIIEEELYDREFVEEWTLGFEQLGEHVKRFTPEWAQDITKLRADDIREVARMYATTRPASIREGNAMDQYPNVAQTVRAIGILCAITGNLDVKGGNVFFPRTKLARYLDKRPNVKPLGSDRYPLFPGVTFPCFVDAVLSGEPYPPKAMIVHHANPLLINANSQKTRQALERLEFLVVCDIFKSATAELADIILPEASDFERYGFNCYPCSEGAFVALRRKVIEPVGESRPVFDMEYEISKKMGLDSHYPWRNTEEWINYRLRADGITLEELKKQSVIYTTPQVEYRKYQKIGFNTPSGKVELFSKKFEANGYSPLPTYKELDEVFDGQPGLLDTYPLVGTTRRPGVYVHTRFRNIPMLRKKEPDPLVRLSPGDAQTRQIKDGDLTLVESPNGTIKIRAKVTDEVSSGVVIIDFGWGNPWDQGANVNILTSDEDRDPVSCSTPNRRFRCQVSRVNP